jgi:hypothetical protein
MLKDQAKRGSTHTSALILTCQEQACVFSLFSASFAKFACPPPFFKVSCIKLKAREMQQADVI